MFVIGVDFGTHSARAIVVACADGAIVGSAVSEYHSGDHGVLTHPSDPRVARQNPADYIGSLSHAITTAMMQAGANADFSRDRVVAIGVATTGSTPLPLDANARPLSINPDFEGHLDAQAWLWNDRSAEEEAAEITRIAEERAPEYLDPIAGTYSAEWFWSKMWKCLKVAPDVFNASATWVELADFVPAVLAGVDHPRDIVRCISAARDKAIYADAWGGLPDKEFLARLDPKLAELRDRLYDRALPAGIPAGNLCKAWANALGLREGIVIAMGGLDEHYAAVGCGIGGGTVVQVIGTSTCDYLTASEATNVRIAARQPIGDVFDRMDAELIREAGAIPARASGLLRPDASSDRLLIGISTPISMAAVYRALIEASAFGARTIVHGLRQQGVPIERMVCRGAFAEPNDVIMQIYADVMGVPMLVGPSHAAALGAAVAAAVTAGEFDSWSGAQQAMIAATEQRFTPNAGARYD